MSSIHETDCAALRFELELIVQELADIEEAATHLRRRISALLHSTETPVVISCEANIDTSDAATTTDDALDGHTAPNSADGPLALVDLPDESDAACDLAAPEVSGIIVKVAEAALERGDSEATSHSSVRRCESPAAIEIVIEFSAEDVDFVPLDVELPASEPIRLIALPVVHSNQAVAIIPSPQMRRSWGAPIAAASVMLVGLLILCTNSLVPDVISALARHWV
jgi:hypothetical protein